ncbi:MAG: butyrate kinase [Chloroflexi bacterium]|nr:butyrate kinase [Chloroflexota bacterium]
MHRILVINPGSTSTEVSLFEDEKEVRSARIMHPVSELRKFDRVIGQFPYRNEAVKKKIAEWGLKRGDLAAVVGRSGFYSSEAGTYEVSQRMIDDVKSGRVRVEHPAALGCLLARETADEHGVRAFIAQPSYRDWDPIAKVSGLPGIERRAAYHENIEAVARVAARDMNKAISNTNLVIAHLEGGMSIAALEGGKLIDATSALDEGPFTTERAGSLPGVSLVEICFSGKYRKEQVLKMIRGEGGMVAYLGTNSLGEVERRIGEGDRKAEFYLEAMCYQIAKDIGAMAAVLRGKVDAVVLTGKILESPAAVNWIRERVSFVAPVKTYPEEEGLLFAQAGLRVLRGEESPREYG